MNMPFIAIPHGGMVCPGALEAITKATQFESVSRASSNSILCQNFNMLWCDAMNLRKTYGVTHFAMFHYDVRPEHFWLDKLIAEMDRVDADIISVILAIKDDRGLTSTGIGYHDNPIVRRLSMYEVYDLPETFSCKDTGSDFLAVNTGLWVARINTGWADRFPGFWTHTGIAKQADGKLKAVNQPEDWLMSKWAADEGLNVFATRSVKAWHRGFIEYGNDEAWGDWAFDHENANGQTGMIGGRLGATLQECLEEGRSS